MRCEYMQPTVETLRGAICCFAAGYRPSRKAALGV